MDRLDAARFAAAVEITPAKVIADLEAVRLRALEIDTLPVALRASELQGRHIGMWRNEPPAEGRTLEQMIAGVPRIDDGEKAAGA